MNLSKTEEKNRLKANYDCKTKGKIPRKCAWEDAGAPCTRCTQGCGAVSQQCAQMHPLILEAGTPRPENVRVACPHSFFIACPVKTHLKCIFTPFDSTHLKNIFKLLEIIHNMNHKLEIIIQFQGNVKIMF